MLKLINSQHAREAPVLDKRWLAILSIAIIGMSLDQVTTSYAVTAHTEAIESNVFLNFIFRTLPQPFNLVFYGLLQTVIVMWTIMILWSSSPHRISFMHAAVTSTVIAFMPMAAGINNIFVLLF